MTHVRTRIALATVATLGGIQGVKSVRPTKRFPYDPEQLPAIDVSFVQEPIDTAEAGRPGTRMQTRHPMLRVRIVGADVETPPEDPTTPIDFVLNEILAEVEARMAANQLLVGPDGVPCARRVVLRRVDDGESSKGNQHVSAVAAFFEILASHREGQPASTVPSA